MIAEWIFAHARASPDETALRTNGSALSYRMLAARIVQMRRVLERTPISRERVAVLCINDIASAWIVGLALRSLGVTTVNARSLAELDQLGLRDICLVFSANETAAWPGLVQAGADRPVIVVPDVRTGDAPDFGEGEAVVGAAPGAHILLTSGTTGQYKKVLIDAAAEADVAVSNAELTGLSPASVIHVFDFGGWTAAGYFWPASVWRLGGAVVVDQGPRLSLRAGAAPGRPSVAIVTPHLVERLLAGPTEPLLDDHAMTLFVVGGLLSIAQWSAARERLTPSIRSIYGATETRLMTFTLLETPEDLHWHRINPGCDLQIVDAQDRPMPSGQVGSVRMRPTRVGGYLDDPEATRVFFRDGYFYTGDLGLIGEDGRLALRGRTTDVINVLGDKFSTLPIETALQERLGAIAVCVFSAPGERGEEVHVAIQPGRSIGAAELKAALLDAMPRGTADVQVHAVTEFPRNHMGKIERSALTARFVAPSPG